MRRTALFAPLVACLLSATPIAQAHDGCDITVEASRPEPGAAWEITGARPSILTVVAQGETVSWALVAGDHRVDTVVTETFPGEDQETEEGTVRIGSSLTVIRSADAGSVTGPARVSFCVQGPASDSSAPAGDTLPPTGIDALAPYVGGAAVTMVIGAMISGTAVVVGRRISGS